MLIAELLLRIASPPSLRVVATDAREFVRFHPRLGWTNRPGAHTRFRFGSEFDNDVRISSAGLQDREFSRDRAEGTFRVLALGDSFTFGQGVEAAEAWPKVLEGLLAGPSEVLNSGVSGWGTAQELLWLEEEGLSYRPDAVVVAFYSNDFWDNEAAPPEDARRPRFALRDGRPVALNLPLASPPADALRRVGAVLGNRSFLFRALDAQWRSVEMGWLRPVDLAPLRSPRPSGVAPAQRSPVVVPAVGLTGALLSRMAADCRERAIRFVVVLVPGNWQVRPALRGLGAYAAQKEAYDVVRGLCTADGLEIVDPLGPLSTSEESGNLVYHRIDMHWNAAGHRLVAGLVADRLRAR